MCGACVVSCSAERAVLGGGSCALAAGVSWWSLPPWLCHSLLSHYFCPRLFFFSSSVSAQRPIRAAVCINPSATAACSPAVGAWLGVQARLPPVGGAAAPPGQGLPLLGSAPLGDSHSSRVTVFSHTSIGAAFHASPHGEPQGPHSTWFPLSKHQVTFQEGVLGASTSSSLGSVWSDRSWASSSMATRPPCLHASSSFPIFLSLVLLSTCPGRRGAIQSGWGSRVRSRAGQHLCPLAVTGVLCPSPTHRPHADLLLCFGSDRFPVGWLPVVFSLWCTDENSPFCCEGQTMHG